MNDRNGVERSETPDGRPMKAQPAWRRDFCIDWPEDHYVARRDFVKFLVLTSFAFVVGHLWIGAQNWLRQWRGQPPRQRIARRDEVPVGSAVAFDYPGPHEPCLLLRPSTDTLLAYSQQCTHLSCAVVPELEKGRLNCPCHKGYFDLASGRPIAGPPRRPLPRILIQELDGVIYATGVEVTTV